MPRVALAAALLLGVTPALHAQEWRTFEASRPAGDTTELTVRLRYGAGRLTVRPADRALLYRVAMRYDASRTEPEYRFDPALHTLHAGIADHSGRADRDRDGDTASFTLELGTGTPVSLEAELGALSGTLELGGLRLRDLALKTGASDLDVVVSTPTAEPLRFARIEAGAASLRVRRLGNARPARVRASVGVGTLDLDLTGSWAQTMDVSADVALGGLTLRVPADAGLEVDASTFLAGFEKAGLTKRGGLFYSDNWERAPRRIRLRLNAVMGNFTLRREGSASP